MANRRSLCCEQQREDGWLGDAGGLSLALRGKIGVVHRERLRAGRAGAKPDEFLFEGVGQRRIVAQGLRVVEAIGVKREVRLRDEQIEVGIHERRRILQQLVEAEIEEDREALVRGKRHVAEPVTVFPQVLSGRGVGEICRLEDHRRGPARWRKREQEDGENPGEAGFHVRSGETAMIAQHSFYLRNCAASRAGRIGNCQTNALLKMTARRTNDLIVAEKATTWCSGDLPGVFVAP